MSEAQTPVGLHRLTPGFEPPGKGRLSVQVGSIGLPKASPRRRAWLRTRPLVRTPLLRPSGRATMLWQSTPRSPLPVTPQRLPRLSNIAVRHALSILVRYYRSCNTREPTLWPSRPRHSLVRAISSRQMMRMRAALRGALVAATHPQQLPSSPSRIPFSICRLILLALTFSLSASSMLIMSTVQYSVCVKVEFV